MQIVLRGMFETGVAHRVDTTQLSVCVQFKLLPNVCR